MNVMITGAAGFIGSQLAHALWTKNVNLILVDNFSFGHEDNLIFSDVDLRSRIIRLDIRDKFGVKKLLQENQIEYIYNIAGIAPLPDCQLNPQEAIDVNVSGFVNVLEMARLCGVKKIIQASTNAIYENEKVFPFSEDSASPPTLIYPNTKYSADIFAKSYCDTYGMSVSCLRFANVYGPHIDCLRKQPPFMAYMVRELYYGRQPIFHSNGEQRRDYIYIDDLIDLALEVQSTEGFDIVNVSSNKSYSVNEIYTLAQEIMGLKINAKFADDLHYWEKYPELFEGVYPILSNIINNEINKYTQTDNSYAQEKYSWEPKVSIRNGLTKLIEEECLLLDKLSLDS
ncbi:NAD-dependent epimerase/dehydratase family protein [Candidatus Thioglobus sp.]|nr:NAD-dependent epimerase/dehydratase family protein [Candidatus Thioglobus sp.]